MRSRLFVYVVILLLPVALSGCFSSNPQDIEAFLRPNEVNVTMDNYVLSPPDAIEVYCTKAPEIHMQRQQIRPDGKVSFEAVGELQAAGKTTAQLAEELKQKILLLYALPGDYPIDVRVFAFKSHVYYVLGQVYYQGPNEYTGRDTVLTALARSRPSVLAWTERVQVIRPSSDENVKPMIFEVNYEHMIVHGDLSKNVLLQEGDIVYVPPTILAAIAMKIEELVTPIGRAFSTVNIVQGPPQYK